jgi:hypothetical protein
MLRDPAFDLDAIWEHANDRERRVLIEELIETVTIHADRLDVTVAGAPGCSSPSMRWVCGPLVREVWCRSTELRDPVPPTGIRDVSSGSVIWGTNTAWTAAWSPTRQPR